MGERIPYGSHVMLRPGDTLIVKKRGGGERNILPCRWWINRNTPVGEDAELWERMPHQGHRAIDRRNLIAVERQEPAMTSTPNPAHEEVVKRATADLMKLLADPNAVHVNMLRGSIAKPSVAQIVHLYGKDALRAALATPNEDAAITAVLLVPLLAVVVYRIFAPVWNQPTP